MATCKHGVNISGNRTCQECFLEDRYGERTVGGTSADRDDSPGETAGEDGGES